MKVNVLQVDDAKFLSKWSLWSKWVDVAVYNFNHTPYLIQMRVSRLNGKRFRSIPVAGGKYMRVTANEVGDLNDINQST